MSDALQFQLLNDFQRDFPLCPAPFAELASRLGVAEGVVIRELEHLRREGRFRASGPSLHRSASAPRRWQQWPCRRKTRDRGADGQPLPEVNHNYEREHRFNLWFVVTAGSEGRLQAALGAIEQAAGYPILRLPLEQEFHIDLGFCLNGGEKTSRRGPSSAHTYTPPRPLEELERRLVMALQEGLPFFIRPFQVLAQRVGCEEIEVLERIRRWCDEGIIKRFGVVVRHHELGFRPMPCSYDIPDSEVERVGNLLAQAAGVTLCYRRPRVLPDWPYNLFCMIHGQAREEVEARIATLRAEAGLQAYPHEILFSLTRFKQTGARYA